MTRTTVDVAKTTVESPYWTPAETAAYLRLEVETLRNWRHRGGRGPTSIKVGTKVLYPIAGVIAYAKECERASAVGGAS